MKFPPLLVNLSLAAHVLAWGAFLFLAFWPHFYRGVQARPAGPDGPGGELVPVAPMSLIEGAGWWALVPMLVPAGLTAVALVVTLGWDPASFAGKLLLWIVAALLILFCLASAFTLGLFYLPAALALVVTALVMSVWGGPAAERSTGSGD